MKKTILQIPMSKELRFQAEKAALEEGFSSLQETVRLFLQKLAKKAISITFYEQPKTIQLSPKAIKRYNKMIDDVEKGRNIYCAKDINDLMAQLHGDILPRKVSQKLS
jgi:hypothetical protein